MRKKFIGVIAVLLSLVMFAFCGCTNKPQDGEPPAQAMIRLRSDAEQELKVGDKRTLVYSTANTTSEVMFTSSDETVVTVDKFASVTAVGAGEATVTLALVDEPSVKATVSFTVTRNNFMRDNGYFNGNIDFGRQDLGEPVHINGEQVQLLANAAGQHWYFKTHIDHRGYTNSDPGGYWGVGSFLVNSANPIGNTMFWFMLRRKEQAHLVESFYGGWRYATSIPADSSTLLSDAVYDITDGVDFTIMRSGTMHYCIAEFGSGDSYRTYKFQYDIPLFDNLDTYPGVFSQNQLLTVKDYTMSNDEAVVAEKLATYQLAESVAINGPTSDLAAGSYRLTSTVMPDYTINKSVTYALKTAVDGVDLESDGTLTIASGAVGSTFTVVATAVSDKAVKAERTYTVIEKPSSTSTLFDTGIAVYDGAAPVYGDTTATTAGTSYIPLVAHGEKWRIDVTVENLSTGAAAVGTEAGIMSASNGFTDFVKLGIAGVNSRRGDVVIERQNGMSLTLANAAAGSVSAGVKNTIGLIKDGSDYYVTVGGKLTKKVSGLLGGDTSPALYSIGGGAAFTNVTVTTDGDAIDDYLAGCPFYIGSYVTVSGDEYTIDAVDFGEKGTGGDTLDWPPDNDYANGIKSSKAFTQNFTIEFTLSDVRPLRLSNGSYDAKILVYLKSERTTSSLQFVIKKTASGRAKCTFVANLDDATWTEYALPADVDILNGTTAVKIVRTDSCVELYLNGVRAYEGEAFMSNTGYWSGATVATPGIGTFLCGVTISNPTFTVNATA